MNVDYFDKDLINELQKITIKSKELIEDFYEKNINFWKHDIYKYENYKNIFKLKNIKEICFSTWNLIDFDISLIFLDSSSISVYVVSDDVIKWLNQYDFIK